MNIFEEGFRNRRYLAVIAALSMVLGALSIEVARAQTELHDGSRGVLTVAPAIKKAAPAIVSISVRTRVPVADNPLYRDPAFRRFFSLPAPPPERELLSAGSGVIMDAQKAMC